MISLHSCLQIHRFKHVMITPMGGDINAETGKFLRHRKIPVVFDLTWGKMEGEYLY